MVADPKALQYILHSGYNFPKRKDMVIVTEMVAGKNALVCANGKPLPIMGFTVKLNLDAGASGKVHERQRKISAPAFFASRLKSFIPIFQEASSKVSNLY